MDTVTPGFSSDPISFVFRCQGTGCVWNCLARSVASGQYRSDSQQCPTEGSHRPTKCFTCADAIISPSAMHTVVEALFWFHPLVWMAGEADWWPSGSARVMKPFFNPDMTRPNYAEGILKVCRSNVTTPRMYGPACPDPISGNESRSLWKIEELTN